MDIIDNTNFIKELNEKQVQIYQTFKNTLQVQQKNVFTPEILDEDKELYMNQNEIIRILIAREFDTKKSLEMWKNWIKWREVNKPKGIKEKDIEEELKTGKSFQNGYDLQKNPILVSVVRRHIPGAIDKEITQKFFIFILEDALKKSKIVGTGRITIFVDMTGYTKKNFSTKDSDLIKKLLAILQENYPECLAKLIIYKPNWLFKLIFAIVKPFLSKRTKENIVLVKSEKELKNYIDDDNIPQENGGKNKYQYAYPPGSKPIIVLEGKIEEVEQPENGEDTNIDQKLIE